MDSRYDPKQFEQKIYKMWENGNYFNPTSSAKGGLRGARPFTILLPPPNASGKMHAGNVLMIAIEDLLIRYHRMRGDKTLWIPGTDHAGFETQITFERELKKQGKSRFDFDRKTLYQKIWDFVHENKNQIENQIREMGASVDWSRYTFTLDEKVIKTVYETFKKMHQDGLIYRGDYLVNYCPKCGTTFADLETTHIERKDPFYCIKYKLVNRSKNEPEYLTIATVRPETIFADTHLAVNPKDKKRKKWIGRKLVNPLTKIEMPIIADNFVDPKFGTGIVKLTPAHDKNDYEVGLKHKLPMNVVIDWNGRMTEKAGEFKGKTVFTGRKEVVEKLKSENVVEKVDNNYVHSIMVCYKGNHDIEPMIIPNWFVKVDDSKKSLKKPAYEAVKKGKIKIFPKWQEKKYLRWMEEMHDWPISRQVIWGIRIPVWYKVKPDQTNIWVYFLNKKGELKQGNLNQYWNKGYTLEEIENGLQRVFPLTGKSGPDYIISDKKPSDGNNYLPETDTFDTWFSSGQWPLVTLGYPENEDFKTFYPTSVLETGWEIIRLWVSRMVMFGIYLTEKVPFEYVYLHGIIRAKDGRKMSKSLGNIVNPEDYIEKYGVDALRMGLIAGTATGKDFNFPEDKIIAYRNFANKLWNIGRFIEMQKADLKSQNSNVKTKTKNLKLEENKKIVKKLEKVVKKTAENIEKFRFAQAAEDLYHFTWHEFADIFIENCKLKIARLPAKQENLKNDEEAVSEIINTLIYTYSTCLRLLHPFMPFVTEAIWQKMFPEEKPLIISPWPKN